MDRTVRTAERTYQEPGVDEQPPRFPHKSIDPDSALVAQLRRADPEAAEALVSAYGDRVYRLAIRITGNASDAEEVVHAAVEDLPPAYRVAIVLRDLQGSSMREVADALRLSVAKAKSRVHRGRLFLRKRLAMLLDGATIADSASSQKTGSGRLYDDVAVESTTRQLASDEVAFTRLPDLLTL